MRTQRNQALGLLQGHIAAPHLFLVSLAPHFPCMYEANMITVTLRNQTYFPCM